MLHIFKLCTVLLAMSWIQKSDANTYQDACNNFSQSTKDIQGLCKDTTITT